jgi:hypothetical protein
MPETDTEIAHDLRDFALGHPIIGDAPLGLPADNATELPTHLGDGRELSASYRPGYEPVPVWVNQMRGEFRIMWAQRQRVEPPRPSPMASIRPAPSAGCGYYFATLAVAVAVLVWRWAL